MFTFISIFTSSLKDGKVDVETTYRDPIVGGKFKLINSDVLVYSKAKSGGRLCGGGQNFLPHIAPEAAAAKLALLIRRLKLHG